MHNQRSPHPSHLRLTLLANGIDFVRTAVILLYSDTKLPLLAHKYAILHVFSGLLLILKDRLSREHPALMWADVNNCGKPESRTVDFDGCLNRLKSTASVAFDDSQLRLLRRAQSFRNQIEHYEVEVTHQEAETLVAELVEFVFVFMREQLEENLEDYLPRDAWLEVQKLRQIARRLQEERDAIERAAIVAAELRYGEAMERASPHEQARLRRAYRYMMMTSAQLESLIEQQKWDFHEPTPDPLECHACGDNSVVVVEQNLAICTNTDCREPHHAHLCTRCGGPQVLGSNLEEFCESCYNEMARYAEED